jgi:predicted RNA-binding protein with PIN domain
MGKMKSSNFLYRDVQRTSKNQKVRCTSLRYNDDMPYLVDGHNLIPKVGLHLDSINDEMELVAILQEFARLHRRQVEVYFDGAPAGQAGTRSLGTVKAHFVRTGTTADDAIRCRLKKMGRGAKNWTVVSSDRQVQTEARDAQAKVLTSDEFARMLLQTPRIETSKPAADRKISPAEVDEWLKIFASKGHRTE